MDSELSGGKNSWNLVAFPLIPKRNFDALLPLPGIF
jgi:hypothetical protein